MKNGNLVAMAMTRLKDDTKAAVKSLATQQGITEDEVVRLLLAAYEQANGATVQTAAFAPDSYGDLFKRLEAVERLAGANARAHVRSLVAGAAREEGMELPANASRRAQFDAFMTDLRDAGADSYVLEAAKATDYEALEQSNDG